MRAFVVGNGESLARTDLNKLIGEISFVCNNIHLIYAHTDFRPTHYIRAEESRSLSVEDWGESVETHRRLGCEMWLNNMFGKADHKINACSHYRKHYNNPEAPHLWHLPVLCTFGSSVNVAVQIAHTLGYSPIYLVGCDLGSNMNHFMPNYRHGKEQPNRYANLDALAAHMVASRSGEEIYNATIGGELEVYERVEFRSLF